MYIHGRRIIMRQGQMIKDEGTVTEHRASDHLVIDSREDVLPSVQETRWLRMRCWYQTDGLRGVFFQPCVHKTPNRIANC